MFLKVTAKRDKKLENLDDLSEYLRTRESQLRLTDLNDITIKLNENLRTEFSDNGNNEGFLFDANTGKIFSLNTTASFIFSKIQEGLPLAEIIKQITLTFDVDESHAINDLQDFIYQLRELGIGVKE
jgi:hypothetical protein